MNLEEWTQQGSYVTVHGRRMFVVDTGGEDLPALVILHGYSDLLTRLSRGPADARETLPRDRS